MNIYISGPITNYKNADTNFKEAEALMRKMYPNAKIYNPINIPTPKYTQDDWGTEGVWSYYMHESIKLMMECDTIYLLNGWSSSKGATIEFNLAWALDMTILYETDIKKMRNDEPQ